MILLCFLEKWENFKKKLDKNSDNQIHQLPKFADYHETAKLNGVKHTALLKAKKLICGDEWNSYGSNEFLKWKEFLKMLELLGKDGFFTMVGIFEK